MQSRQRVRAKPVRSCPQTKASSATWVHVLTSTYTWVISSCGHKLTPEAFTPCCEGRRHLRQGRNLADGGAPSIVRHNKGTIIVTMCLVHLTLSLLHSWGWDTRSQSRGRDAVSSSSIVRNENCPIHVVTRLRNYPISTLYFITVSNAKNCQSNTHALIPPDQFIYYRLERTCPRRHRHRWHAVQTLPGATGAPLTTRVLQTEKVTIISAQLPQQ